MTQLSVSEARAILPEVLDRVAAGEEITITRHGHPVAVLLRPDAVRVRRAEQAIEQARRIGALVASARERPLAPAAVPDQRVEELVEAARAGRRRS
jgi:prevent-host-death family protein